MSSLLYRYIETLFERNKYRVLTQYILDKDFKTSSLLCRYIEILFERDKR